MKLQQLRYLCKIADEGLKFSRAAESLHTSQPGISKQIRLLEQELGVDIFRRRSGRIVEVTELGEHLLGLAKTVLRDADRLKDTAREFVNGNSGHLAVAATYTLARYVLPQVFEQFVSRYPGVRLSFSQGDPAHISKLAASGKVDIAVTTRHEDLTSDVVLVDFCKLERVLLVPKRHPLLEKKSITLASIAQHPLIRLGQHQMRRTFAAAKLSPKVVFDDLDVDVDVVKALVGAGLGIAILPHITYQPSRDCDLRAIPLRHIFEPHVGCLAFRKHHYTRRYMLDFISLLAPQLDARQLKAALAAA